MTRITFLRHIHRLRIIYRRINVGFFDSVVSFKFETRKRHRKLTLFKKPDFMTTARLTFLAFITIVAALAAPPARAAEPETIGRYGQWTAYSYLENGNKVCYIAASPQKAEGNYSRRGDIYAMITHRPGEGARNVFSYITGYPYKDGSKTRVQVDGKTFTLFTRSDTAWAPDAAGDRALADALRAGSTMVVKGTSSRGTETTDTFSLSGSSNALDAIDKACP